MIREIYKHGYSGSCSPNRHGYSILGHTFSVGCFQWLPTVNGKTLKKSPVKFRVKGYCAHQERVYAMAEDVCKKLDNGWKPIKKSCFVKS